jgi:hypothetical protein
MVGVPFGVIRKIFAFADQDTIEQSYKMLAALVGRPSQVVAVQGELGSQDGLGSPSYSALQP